MSILNIILAILLFASAIFLIVAVLMQSGKSKGVSSAITGGASETYFGKNKGKSQDKKMTRMIIIISIVFAVLALVTYIIQPYVDFEDLLDNLPTSTKSSSSVTSGSGKDPIDSGIVSSGVNGSAGDKNPDPENK